MNQKLDDTLLDKQSLIHSILKIQEMAKRIPEDQKDALETIAVLLKVVETYAAYMEAMKGEFIKLDRINQELRKKLADTGGIILPFDIDVK